MSNKFLQNFRKEREKIKGVATHSGPPKMWLSSGFFAINKIISGYYDRGIALGRMIMLTGPSNSGKSFLGALGAKIAQKMGWGVFILDSENALDDDYMKNVGVDVENELYVYNAASTLSSAKKLLSSFLQGYRKNAKDLPPFYILIDSLDMLMTDSEEDKHKKGEMSNDMGQHAKQLKRFLNSYVQDIKDLDIIVACTKQPYQNQNEMTKKQRPWIITEALRFAFSQILLVTNVRLKDKKNSENQVTYNGITLTAFGEKTRFCKPFQKCKIEIPYDGEINSYSGLLDIAIDMGIVEQSGAWYSFNGKNYQGKNNIEENLDIMQEIFEKIVEKDNDNSSFIDTKLGEDEIEDTKLENKKSRRKKLVESITND